MSKYLTTVIKTGNSYALRVPKSYILDGQLQLGDKVPLDSAKKQNLQDQSRALELIDELQKLGAFADIKDPVAWQQSIRKERPQPGRT